MTEILNEHLLNLNPYPQDPVQCCWLFAQAGLVLVACAALWAAAGEVRRAGWLDRLVHHFKHNFLEDLKQLAPINIQGK